MESSLPFVSILMRARNDEALIGRVVNALGEPIDGKGAIEKKRGFRCGSSSAPPGRTSPGGR